MLCTIALATVYVIIVSCSVAQDLTAVYVEELLPGTEPPELKIAKIHSHSDKALVSWPHMLPVLVVTIDTWLTTTLHHGAYM